MSSTISSWASGRWVKIVLSAAIIVAVVFAGLFAYAYFTYSNDIAVKVHGIVIVANGYGSPYDVDLYTNAPPPSFHVESATPVDPVLLNNSAAYYSVIVISGHEYNIDVSVSAPGKGAPADCALEPRLPDCTVCQASSIQIPFATTDYSHNITVTC
jgi:hypothetical protein